MTSLVRLFGGKIFILLKNGNIEFLSGINKSKSLPNKGGLWVQPLNIPNRPKVSNKTSQGQTSPWKIR